MGRLEYIYTLDIYLYIYIRAYNVELIHLYILLYSAYGVLYCYDISDLEKPGLCVKQTVATAIGTYIDTESPQPLPLETSQLHELAGLYYHVIVSTPEGHKDRKCIAKTNNFETGWRVVFRPKECFSES